VHVTTHGRGEALTRGGGSIGVGGGPTCETPAIDGFDPASCVDGARVRPRSRRRDAARRLKHARPMRVLAFGALVTLFACGGKLVPIVPDGAGAGASAAPSDPTFE